MQYTLDALSSLDLDLYIGDTIFLFGDLGVGKTTLIRSILERYLPPGSIVRSPTYTYVNQYQIETPIDASGKLESTGVPTQFAWYHFDLYRIDEYETFINIGGEEMLDDSTAIRCIEWPEKLSPIYKPSVTLTLTLTPDENIRDIVVVRHFIP